jgi:hypothetical protein
MTKLPPLRELHFGELDASQEAARSPELLTKGYFDFRNAAYAISSQGTWLLLGPKGAGKSAVLEYLKLSWQGRYDRFFKYWALDSFPVVGVGQLDPSGHSGQRAQPAWEMLLLLKLLESFAEDEGATKSNDFTTLVQELRKSGLLTQDLARVVTSWASNLWTIDLKLFKWSGEQRSKETSITDIVHDIRKVLEGFSTESQHLLALDGLDTFFFEGGTGWESLSGLIDALAAVNNFLLSLKLPASVVMTLRSDHFDALNSQNSNKLKDRTVFLDWTGGGIGAQNSLWQIVTRKAAVARPEVSNLVHQYLSSPVQKPEFPRVAEYLLSYTRLLPRDIVALMGHVQNASPGSSPVTSDAAKAAAKEYSEQYFVGELMNNLSGVLPSSEAYKVVDFRDAMRGAPTRYFNFKYMTEELNGVLTPEQVRALLRRMFETGGLAVSNKATSGKRHTDFTFRCVLGGTFSTRHDYLLHDALTRAWNRPWF